MARRPVSAAAILAMQSYPDEDAEQAPLVGGARGRGGATTATPRSVNGVAVLPKLTASQAGVRGMLQRPERYVDPEEKEAEEVARAPRRLGTRDPGLGFSGMSHQPDPAALQHFGGPMELDGGSRGGMHAGAGHAGAGRAGAGLAGAARAGYMLHAALRQAQLHMKPMHHSAEAQVAGLHEPSELYRGPPGFALHEVPADLPLPPHLRQAVADATADSRGERAQRRPARRLGEAGVGRRSLREGAGAAGAGAAGAGVAGAGRPQKQRRAQAGTGDQRVERAHVVREVMRERGCSMPEASSAVKREGLWHSQRAHVV